MHRTLLLCVTLALATALGGGALVAMAQPAPSASASSGAAAAASSAAPEVPVEPALRTPSNPRAVALRALAGEVRALVAGTLAPGVDPASLFDLDLEDEPAITMEVRRLGIVIDEADARAKREEDARLPATDADAGPLDGGAEADAGAGDAGKRRGDDGGVDEAADAGPPVPLQPTPLPPLLGDIDPEIWAAQLDLDRARLAFLKKPVEERAEILATHADKQTVIAKTERDIDDAEQKALDAEAERQATLEAASRARTEGLRAVGEERARLLGVAKAQADFEAALGRMRKELASRAEATLGWHRRVRETIESARTADRSLDIDAVYDALGVELRASRDRLGVSLDAIGSESHVPVSGDDPLTALPSDVDVGPARAKRAEVDAEGARLRRLEIELRIDRARTDYDEVETLNRDRLALYPSLSADKREAITGFGPAGTDQGRAEARQVALVLRYHFSATLRWFRELRTSSDGRGQSALAAVLIALKWLLPVGLFLAWRRRAKTALAKWQKHLKDERLKEGRVGRSPLERILAFFIRVRTSLEWLLLVATALWLLPVDAAGLLEVALLKTILLWALGGAFVVAAIDALADESPSRARASRLQSAHIRLRSLRLIGWVVVLVGLLLSLSDKLVGKGTIYDWVFSTCWFAAVPIALLLVRWWRPIIFDRVELKRRKSAFDRWVLGSKTGLRSLVTASAGGAYLFAVGAFRAGRTWISTFELTRRFLAYLFRRDITKRADELSKLELVALGDDAYQGLGPSMSTGEIVPSVADAEVDEIIRRISAAGGGVFAIVGERGAGKTRILDRIRTSCNDITYCQCPFGGEAAFSKELAERFDVPRETALADIACMFDSARRDSGFLIDDAHRLVIPMMGGMKSFDTVLEVARRMSGHCSWVFAFDEVVWRFILRARGAQPLFDDVIHLSAWREEGIARLLQSRTKALKIAPIFDHLVQDLPKDADDVDLQEAIDRTAANYYRLIWDYSTGNPGVALHTWRRCLGVAPDGSIAVRGFRAPEVEELEELPDSAVFVLRAVVQLEQALIGDISRATLLSTAEVKNAISHGVLRGYFKEVDGRYAVTWAWYRPITRFLQRRHLIVLGS